MFIPSMFIDFQDKILQDFTRLDIEKKGHALKILQNKMFGHWVFGFVTDPSFAANVSMEA